MISHEKTLTNPLNELRDLLGGLLLAEGINKTAIPYIKVFRHAETGIVIPDTPNPFIYVVVDGPMRLHSDGDFKTVE